MAAMKRVRGYGPIEPDDLPVEDTCRLRSERDKARGVAERLKLQVDALRARLELSERKEAELAASVCKLSALLRKIRGLPPKTDVMCPRPVILLKK
jgi:hypothetical protein